jgi:hypothetical protein
MSYTNTHSVRRLATASCCDASKRSYNSQASKTECLRTEPVPVPASLTAHSKIKLSHYTPEQALKSSRRFRLTEFPDNLHMKVVRLSALCTGRIYPPGDTPGIHFCQRPSRSQGHSATGRIKSMKNRNYTIGNLTRDQPTAPPRTAQENKRAHAH